MRTSKEELLTKDEYELLKSAGFRHATGFDDDQVLEYYFKDWSKITIYKSYHDFEDVKYIFIYYPPEGFSYRKTFSFDSFEDMINFMKEDSQDA